MAQAQDFVELDFLVTQGDDFVRVFGLRDSNGNDITINSGYTFKFSVVTKKKDISDGSNPSYANNAFPISATYLNTTQAQIKIPNSVLAVLELGTYYYDIQVTYPNNNIQTLQKGKFIVTDQRTKS